MHVQLTGAQQEALEEMADEMNVSQAKVIGTAFALLKVVLRELRKNHRIAVTKDGRVIKRLVGILDVDKTEWLAQHHEHQFGPVVHARMTGEPHRKCQFPGCKVVSLDLDDEEEEDTDGNAQDNA